MHVHIVVNKCRLLYGYLSYVKLLCIGMEGTQYSGCIGSPCLHEQLAKRLGQVV